MVGVSIAGLWRRFALAVLCVVAPVTLEYPLDLAVGKLVPGELTARLNGPCGYDLRQLKPPDACPQSAPSQPANTAASDQHGPSPIVTISPTAFTSRAVTNSASAPASSAWWPRWSWDSGPSWWLDVESYRAIRGGAPPDAGERLPDDGLRFAPLSAVTSISPCWARCSPRRSLMRSRQSPARCR
jgi:hypothetical protein